MTHIAKQFFVVVMAMLLTVTGSAGWGDQRFPFEWRDCTLSATFHCSGGNGADSGS